MADNLTADEAEQYDRQIRLWGLEAQKRFALVSVSIIMCVFQWPCPLT